MSNQSIFAARWIELVFEGRNKSYGAYQLRKENPKTTLLALFYGMLFLGGVSCVFILMSSFGPKPPALNPVTPLSDTLVVVPVHFKEKEEPIGEKPFTKIEKPIEVPEGKVLSDPTVVTAEDNPDDIIAAGQNNTTDTEISAAGLESPGNAGRNPGNASGSSEGSEGNPTTTVISGMLDRQPQFPGGMDDFYSYVGRKFRTPELEAGSRSIRIFVSFVIEIDGSMTDISVQNNPGFGLDKEAIRVLKSLKTKWEPGIYKGKKVRTSYTLPITVKTL